MSQPNPIIVEMTVESNDVVLPMSIATQYDLPIDLETLEADHNGDYSAPAGTAWDSAHVAVPGPSGTIQINANGTHDVAAYASASVNVPNSYTQADEGKVVDNGALVAQTSRTVTSNATYDTTLNNSVTVDVPETEINPLSVTQNGTYTPEQNKAFGTVTVNVPVPGIYYTEFGHCYSENMIIPLVNLTGFGSQYRGASNLKTVKVYPVSGVISSSAMGSQAFMDCASLESAIVTAWPSIAVQTFRNCTALKTAQLGDVGFSVAEVKSECFYSDRQADLTITIYVDDNTAIPLSGSPWGATNATIIYRSSTTGEVRTA